ncbi:MAG TPA: cob(I)yrinic acid a,c-diamide adenosyltransferase [Phnomibacter sp.]|nr:cob(I)yrinic acid a,c-diamide adenosyltransferase [Phnomibacter sp.]
MALKIYTKTGDNGTTSLIGGTKVSKDHIRIESYGSVDELNSYIGLITDLSGNFYSTDFLRQIQDRLFTIGSSLACDPEKEPGFAIPDLKQSDIEQLEREIDRMNLELPEMKHFILPGGHPTVSHIHIARCVCRRAERQCVHLNGSGGKVEQLVIVYLNRLSDYLFVLARFVSKQLEVTEIAWRPRV